MPEETSPHLLLGTQDQRLDAEQDQLSRRPAETSAGNRQEMVRACRTPRQLSQTILQGTSEDGGRRVRQRKSWMYSFKEWTSLPMPELLMMVSHPKTGRGFLLNRPSCPSPLLSARDDLIGKGTERNWTDMTFAVDWDLKIK